MKMMSIPDRMIADQKRQDEDHHPGSRLEKLARIEPVTVDHRFEPRADLDIPVDIQEQRDRQGHRGQDEDSDRMKEPFRLFHNTLDRADVLHPIVNPSFL